MNIVKAQFLAAAAVAGLVGANSAQAAGVVYPSVDLQGNGTSSIVVVLNKTLQCLGNPDAPIGEANGFVQPYPAHNYQPLSPSGGNPAYNCAVQSVQPNLTAHYISTGSGGGKRDWKNFNTAGIVADPFGFGSHIQYAFSDSPINSNELSQYNDIAIPHDTGAAIQIPFYVLPVAITYAPVYGKRNTGSGVVNLSFNVKSTFVQTDGAGNPTGGFA